MPRLLRQAQQDLVWSMRIPTWSTPISLILGFRPPDAAGGLVDARE